MLGKNQSLSLLASRRARYRESSLVDHWSRWCICVAAAADWTERAACCPGLASCAGSEVGAAYRVQLRAQANFSAPTFEPAHEALAGQCAALSVQLRQLQLRCSTSINSPQASSPRSELSGKRAAKNVIDFCRADRNVSSKSLASYFKARNANLKLLDDRKKKKKNSSIDLQRAFASASVDRSSISSASVATGLFPNLSCLVS